jgi:hypothetical protein
MGGNFFISKYDQKRIDAEVNHFVQGSESMAIRARRIQNFIYREKSKSWSKGFDVGERIANDEHKRFKENH